MSRIGCVSLLLALLFGVLFHIVLGYLLALLGLPWWTVLLFGIGVTALILSYLSYVEEKYHA